MVENNKCNAEQYEDISKHISALLWLNENGGWEIISKRLMPKGYSWPRFDDDSFVMIGDKFIDGMGNVDRVVYVSFEPNYYSLHGDNGNTTFQMGECLKRPKIIGKDGKQIVVGETVYGQDAKAWEVTGFNYRSQHSVIGKNGDSVRDLKPEWLSHEKPDTYEDIFEYVNSNAFDELQAMGNGMYENIKTVPFEVVEIALERIRNINSKFL